MKSSDDQEIVEDRPIKLQKHFQGWRMGASLCVVAAGTILLMNIIVVVAASAKNGVSDGLATFQEGSCSKTSSADFWLHLLINVISTVLLAASNYCMQCASAPTREDVDKAHLQHRWLDIGVPSVRNLRNVSGIRLALWWSLALSSIPLHLLYNSTVLSTQISNEYNVYVASPILLSGTALNWSAPIDRFGSFGYHLKTNNHPLPLTLDDLRNISSWDRLSNEACIQAYSQTYITGRGDVLAITSETSTLNATRPVLQARYVGAFSTARTSATDWICSAYAGLSCDLNSIEAQASSWKLNDTLSLSPKDLYSVQYPVEYCLSQPVQERCTLQLSLVIMAVVIVCNAVKLTSMVLLLRQLKCAPLVTIGDAIESFMLDRDTTTQGMCWANKQTFVSKQWGPSARPYLKQGHFWFASASVRRWFICNFCSMLTIVVAGILLGQGLGELRASNTNTTLWNSGFGTFNSKTKGNWNLRGTGGVLGLAVLANIPQLLLSFLFLTYNGLFTCMLLAEEWSRYAYERRPLRVTDPVGSQRSTYRLQLPYKYSIPLMIISTILHLLVSRSLFLARISLYTRSGKEDTENSTSTIGYSCLPLLVVLILGSVTVLVGLLNGCRRYRAGIPLVGSCSAAVSAACHVAIQDPDGPRKRLLWGDVGASKDGVGHCSFTSLDATPPVKGEKYAG